MIETKKEYDEIIDSYEKFMKEFKNTFMKNFEAELFDLNDSMDAFIRIPYKQIMFDINIKVVESLNKRTKKILKLMRGLKTSPTPHKVLVKVIKESKQLLNTLSFWSSKMHTFLKKVHEEFDSINPKVQVHLDKLSALLGDSGNQEGVFYVLETYLYKPKLLADFDVKPIGKLQLAKVFIQLWRKKEGRIKLKTLKKYSTQEKWDPKITAINQYGTFKPKFHFHVYIHHMYKVNFIEKVLTKKLGEDIKKQFQKDMYTVEGGKGLDKLAKFQALYELFKDKPNIFTEVMLNYLLYMLKLSYLHDPNKVIRSDYFNVNFAIRDLGAYGGCNNRTMNPSEVNIIESLSYVLEEFSKFAIDFSTKNNLFENKKHYKLGLIPLTNSPKIKNWDYGQNKPQLYLDPKKFKNLLNEYLSLKDNKVPNYLYDGFDLELSKWIHELTHAYDSLKNPDDSKEISSVYKMPLSTRASYIIKFLCDLRSDGFARWRETNIWVGKRHVHDQYNGISFCTRGFIYNSQQAKIKIISLSTLKEHNVVPYMRRAFSDEYYDIGHFYHILYGIYKCIQKKRSYFIYIGNGNKIEKLIDKSHKSLYKHFGGYANEEEIRRSELENVIRNSSEDYCLKLSEKCEDIRKIKIDLKDIAYYEKNNNGPIIEISGIRSLSNVKRTNPDYGSILKKLKDVSNYYLQKIVLIYWKMQRLGKNDAGYQQLLRQYNLLIRMILKNESVFNVITRRPERISGIKNLGSGEIIFDKLLNRSEMDNLHSQDIVNKIEITSHNRHDIGNLLTKKLYFFTTFDQDIVGEVYNEVHNIDSSLDFFKLMKKMDEYFKIPKQFQLFTSVKDLFETLKDAAKLDFEDIKKKGFELTKEEIEEFLSNIKVK